MGAEYKEYRILGTHGAESMFQRRGVQKRKEGEKIEVSGRS